MRKQAQCSELNQLFPVSPLARSTQRTGSRTGSLLVLAEEEHIKQQKQATDVVQNA